MRDAEIFTRRHRVNHSRRSAVTLLEAILALAILGVSLGLLSRIFATGVDAGLEADQVLRCRQAAAVMMDQILLRADAGVPPTAVTNATVASLDPDDPPVMVDVEIAGGSMPGVLQIRVSARIESVDPPRVSLSQWIVDPSLNLDALEAEFAGGVTF